MATLNNMNGGRIEANGTPYTVSQKVVLAIYKSRKLGPNAFDEITLSRGELAMLIEYAINIYTGNAWEVFGLDASAGPIEREFKNAD